MSDDTPTPAPDTPESFLSSLPPDLQTHKSLQKFRDVASLAKSYVELEKKLGQRIPLPDPSSPEAVEEIYAKLGRPDTPEGYQFHLPDEVPWDAETQTAYTQVAHRLGLTSAQAQGLMDWYIDLYQQHLAKVEEDSFTTVEALKKEWGGRFEQNLALAQRAFDLLRRDDPELVDLVDLTGLGNRPSVLRFFATVGRLLAEHGQVPGHVAGVLSPEDAKAKIAEIRGDPKHPANLPSHPKHQEALAELRTLYQVAYGTEPVTTIE